MKTPLMRLFTKASWISLLIASACTSFQVSVPKEIPSVTPTEQLKVDVTPFPFPGDYIIYGKVSRENENSIWMWAINPAKPIPVLISKSVYPSRWSPSARFRLLVGNHSIYTANADGSNVRTIYNSEEYLFFDPFWLSDDVILFNAFKDYFLPPDLYSLNIDSGVVTRLFRNASDYFIQSSFPSEKKWLRAGWSQQTTDIVDENGKVEKFFDGFLIPTDPFSSNIRIQYIKKLDKYLFMAQKHGDSSSKLWLAAEQEIPMVFFDPGSDGIDRFAISPDERYVALAYNTLKGEFLYIFSLENQQLLYTWVYPHTLSNIEFIWSPDSQSIASPYFESTTNGVEEGIKIMNIKTGHITLISKDNVLEIRDWHLVK